MTKPALSQLALRIIRVVPIAVLAMLVPAITSGQQDADLKEMEHYTLTMDKLNRFAGVFSDLAQTAKDHPEIKAAITTEADKHQSIDDLDRQLSAVPQIKAAILHHGFTGHEFIILESVFIQSAMASAMITPGPDRAKRAAEAGMNPANLDFLDQHKAEIDAIQKKMAAAGSAAD